MFYKFFIFGGVIYGFSKKIYKLLDKDILYHYTSSDTAFLYILKNGNLKASSFKNTNDPIEYKPHHIASSYPFEDEKISNISYEIRKNIRKMRSKTKFISFCQNSNSDDIKDLRKEIKNKNSDLFYADENNNKYLNELGCILPRMWSQYGEEHKGVCLAFSRKEIKKEIEKQIGKNKFAEIEYKKFPVIKPKALITDLNGLSSEDIEPQKYAKKFISENYEELFFKKHKDYEDENEYRLIIPYDERNDCEYINIKTSLKAIIFGDNFNKNKYESLIKIFENKYNIFSCDINWTFGTMILK